MRTESKKLLFDIVQAGRAIQQFNPGGAVADYSANPMRRAATERMFEIVGEAMVRLRDTDAATFNRISEPNAIIGFRNRLIHGYDMVDDELVCRTIAEKLPQLLQEVDALLAEPESPQTEP